MRAKDRIVLPIRPRRRKKKISGTRFRLLAALAGCVLLIVGFLAIARAEHSRVAVIEIAGSEAIKPDEARAVVREVLEEPHALIIPGDFIPLVNNDEIIRRLRERFPRIRSIRVARSPGRALAITVEERTLFAILCAGAADETIGTASSTLLFPLPPPSSTSEAPTLHSCAYVDREGFTYSVAPEIAGSLIMRITTDTADIPIGRQMLETKMIHRVAFLADRLPLAIGGPVMDFSFSASVPSELRARAADGFWMIFKRDDDAERALAVLARILRDEIKDRRAAVDYIDLRFGNKVFYKFRE